MAKQIAALALAATMTLLTGCIGINSNADIFFDEVKPGTPEVEMLQAYGTPSFAGFADDQKVYTYKVRNNRYIILLGIYDGYDLVITCEGGQVAEVDKVKRPDTFSLFSPLPWAEGFEN